MPHNTVQRYCTAEVAVYYLLLFSELPAPMCDAVVGTSVCVASQPCLQSAACSMQAAVKLTAAEQMHRCRHDQCQRRGTNSQLIEACFW
jgi:hypothetical protein